MLTLNNATLNDGQCLFDGQSVYMMDRVFISVLLNQLPVTVNKI